jgi:hypothetical protein
MPIHDWSRVEAGIFHHFHHRWISAISDALNAGLLPPDYYALAEQRAAGFGPDVLTLELTPNDDAELAEPMTTGGGTGLLLSAPPVPITAETDMEFYRRKQNTVTVRHVSGDRIVAMVEIVSPGNKSSRSAMRAFVEKAAELLDRQIHLLILDLHRPGPRDPRGIHAEIWYDIAGQDFTPPPGKPLTVVAYESAVAVRCYVASVAVGDELPDMQLFLKPGGHVVVPLEATYRAAFAAVPRRWQRVLDVVAS